MKHSIISTLVVTLTALFISTPLLASPQLDKQFGLRSFVGMVINEQLDPVYAEHVEGEIIRYFRTRHRYDFPQDAYLAFKKDVSSIYLNDPSTPTDQKMAWIRQQIQKLAALGVDAVIVAELFKSGTGYHISFVMTDTTDLTYMRVREVVVDDPSALQNFTDATDDALNKLTSFIPFDGTVVRRDGYRVVLDHSGPELIPGMHLSIYTVERSDTKLFLKETGLIRITEVGDTLSFGMIEVEKKPLEVDAGNKFLLQTASATRDPAFSELENTIRRGELASVGLDLGMSNYTVETRTAQGQGLNASKMFPGADLNGLLWITSHTFFSMRIGFAMGSLKASSTGSTTVTPVNSNVNDVKFMFGYRFGLADAGTGPQISVRAGFMRHQFSVDPSLDPLAFSSMTYSGIAVGAGLTFALKKDYAAGFDANFLLLSSLSEGPYTSGASSSGVVAWDFAVKGIYHWMTSFDVIAKLGFESYSASFSGQGTRPIPLASASQNGTLFQIGVVYAF